jgi:hypothetical protein
MLIFLDIDGVVHPVGGGSDTFLPACTTILEKIITQYNPDIIISSTWKDAYTLKEIIHFFPPSIQENIKDKTPNHRDDMIEFKRDIECRGYIKKYKRTDLFLAIDDDPNHFNKVPVFLTNAETGLVDTDIQKFDSFVNKLK